MRPYQIVITIVSMFFLISTSVLNSDAIGTWKKGMVTKAPWDDKYSRVEINDVIYTLMRGIKISEVYHKDDSIYKDLIPVYQLNLGSRVTFMVEGNRIYQIEKER